MFACMDAPLENVCIASLVITYTACQSWVENRLIACVSFSKLVQFQIHPPPPPLNIPTVRDWPNVKFHYILIDPKVKILISFNSVGSRSYNVVSIVTGVNSFTRLTGFS